MTTDTLTPVVQVPGQLDLPQMPAIPAPVAAAKPATTTKLTGLTNSNTNALNGLPGWQVTKTTATYSGSPTAALNAVQTHMDTVRANQGGRATGYQSLIAVRNKLRECSTGTSHPAVTVTVKRAKKTTTKTRTGSPGVSPKARLTRKRQDTYTTAQLVSALETAWTAIRAQHPDVPAVVIIVGSGTGSKQAKYGHFAPIRWQHGDNQLAEVLISGEGLKRPVEEVFTTLLHEAAHALGHVRDIKNTSRQGRWHNQKFADLASELGLDTTKDPRIGWSLCTLRKETATTYKAVLAELKAALIAYRHPETNGGGETKKNNNNAIPCACQCPRRIRVAKAVLELGDITCGVCDSHFEPDE
ncbi:hypothetical protein Kfla_2089 [Kribbella flavida DSM 17836]|uniref:SprT-like domain-containing protein n=1 Tax=Kribbella flavida (strain DSM 17836 / JCM 10339 / NBRC 14399) TaxID=479435 RepID=D2PS47_KRIFD|nr:hypothetical protein [Kribbella flavida]ADB31171.1 hypothetical protein Kfla_2089 [Kribbella flavida DSM 17836]